MTLSELAEQFKKDQTTLLRSLNNQLETIKRENLLYKGLLRTYQEPKIPTKTQEAALYGLTYTVKDSIAVEGEPLTFGLNPPCITRSSSSADICAQLDKLGAILLASSNLDPAALGAAGQNIFYGNMRNPLNDNIPAGGSSAGAAISVARNWCHFSLASDHGGSIRIPATLSQLAAIKYGSNSFSKKGTLLFENKIDSFGLIAKDCSDLRYISEALLPQYKHVNAAQEISLVVPDATELSCCKEQIRLDFENYIARLSKHHQIIQLSSKIKMQRACELRKVIVAKLYADLVASIKYPEEHLPPELKALILYAAKTPDHVYKNAVNEAEKMSEILDDQLQNSSFLITPALPTPNADYNTEAQTPVNIFLALANISGFPACTLSKPLPLQIIGRQGTELNILDLAVRLNAK